MPVTPVRRIAVTCAVTALVTLGGLGMLPQPAGAASVAYVRLAHLSPDTPDVDVYLDAQSGTPKRQVYKGVGYGVVSDYLKLPVGAYTVAMRVSGADPSTPPVLTTQVAVASGRAYTVAGVGRYADLGLRVINDDLTLPGNGNARVRIIQASIKAPMLDVSVADGQSIASGVAFATTTGYHLVDAGRWTLKVQPSGGGTVTTLTEDLAAGNVYSLIVLDGKSGLTTELRTDAGRRGAVPSGAVETGAGGSPQSWWQQPALLIGVLPVLLGTVVVLLLRRRRLRLHQL